MALIERNKDFDQAEFDAWKATRPASVRALIDKLPLDRRYRIRETGQLVTIVSYFENGTVRVAVDGSEYMALGHDVVGLRPDDLEVI